MVELFGLFITCRNIGRILRRKGIRPTRYQILAVVLWFGFEFLVMQALAAAGVQITPGVYLVGLVAGVASIPVSFGIARGAQPPYRPPVGAASAEPSAGQQVQ
jgi:hypothetical protein